MKYGQLIEYIVKKKFLQKLCRKWGREISLIYFDSLDLDIQ